MKILDIKTMRGPNYWSNYRKKLIVMKLDLEDLEELPTDRIEGFSEKLQELLPSLYSHRCSPGVEGGFFERVKKGTWMGHVIEHIALELQTLAGMDCGYGRTRPAGEKGVYNVVFAYEIESAGNFAAHAAIRIAQSLTDNQPYDLTEDLEELRNILKREGLGPTTLSIVNEAVKRNIPYQRLDKHSLIMLGQGRNQEIVCASITGNTSNIGVSLACDKERTKNILSEASVPVPKGLVIEREKELETAIEEIGFPVVIKPINGNHGRGITTDISSMEQAIEALAEAKKISDEVIIEKFIEGFDYRFLVINYKLVAVAKRTPAMVTGDGTSTISQLIEEVNSDPNRGEGHEKTLTTIKVDQITNAILMEKGLTLDTVLPEGEILFLKNAANISTGGTSKDVTDSVHPSNVFMAERISRLLNLDICGIDVVAKGVSTPLEQQSGSVVEVNAAPGFRMHLAPSVGTGRNVAEPVIDMLYPPGKNARIPIVAITGTNGKTTTTRLIAYLAQKAGGYSTGYCTSDGIYINGEQIAHGDCSGPASTQKVLRDPLVDFAVLECARGGILRSGLGFDYCNISVITNISEDHLGLNDIHTLEELAKVKAVVAYSTHDSGYAILNADDDLVYALKNELDCNVALFSMNAENERIKAHCQAGGLASIVEKDYFVLCKGKWKTKIVKVTDVPLSFFGKAECMIKNILPSILAAVISNFKNKDIATALRSFVPSHELTPGRMNLFRFKNFNLMVDYMHNEGGYQEMKKYLNNIQSPLKIGLIAATGDRRDKDIQNIGYYASQMFDEIIIRHDKNNRGREKEELTRLLTEGILSVNPNASITVISDEEQAIRYAVKRAVKNAFIMVCADKVSDTIAYVIREQEKEKLTQAENWSLENTAINKQ